MPHDAFFRWLFADVGRLRHLLILSGKVNKDIGEFITEVDLDTLVRIPDSYSEVNETGEADLAFRVNVASGAPLLGGIEDNYPSYFRGKILPFICSFVNMADIPDSDCLACEDPATGMGIVAMKYAYDKEDLLKVLPLFKRALPRMPPADAACLMAKISIYLKEYVTQDVLKELDMAFVSIGQKYGFVSAGDVFRQKIAEARTEEQAKAQKQLADAQADTATALREMGIPENQIAEAQARIDALQKKRREQA